MAIENCRHPWRPLTIAISWVLIARMSARELRLNYTRLTYAGVASVPLRKLLSIS